MTTFLKGYVILWVEATHNKSLSCQESNLPRDHENSVVEGLCHLLNWSPLLYLNPLSNLVAIIVFVVVEIKYFQFVTSVTFKMFSVLTGAPQGKLAVF